MTFPRRSRFSPPPSPALLVPDCHHDPGAVGEDALHPPDLLTLATGGRAARPAAGQPLQILAVARGSAGLAGVWPGVLVTLTQTRDLPVDLAVATAGAARPPLPHQPVVTDTGPGLTELP